MLDEISDHLKHSFWLKFRLIALHIEYERVALRNGDLLNRFRNSTCTVRMRIARDDTANTENLGNFGQLIIIARNDNFSK